MSISGIRTGDIKLFMSEALMEKGVFHTHLQLFCKAQVIESVSTQVRIL